MKIKPIKRLFLKVAIIAFLACYAGNAFAIENKSRVVSPYWQSDSGSYTFIAVTHPSLSGMASQIGVIITAIQSDTGTSFADAQSVSFTIDAGTTERIFIVGTNHATINPTAIPTAFFIDGTTEFKHGHILINPSSTNPENKVTFGSLGDGWPDITMLSFWGTVVVEQNTTGFALEFIGDAGDSTTTVGQDPTKGISGTNVGGANAQ